MILQLFLGLVLIALLFFIIGQEKRRRVWSVLLFGAVLGLLYAFFEQINAIGISNVMYDWIPHHTLHANLSFAAAGQTSACLRVMSLCLAALVYLNIIYRREEYSLYINNFILLNFAALIILLSARDLLQLMIGSCCFTIIGFYLINDVAAKTKFIFYNFLAELAIFMSLAVVYANLDTASLSALPKYLKAGHHKDLVSMLLLGAVFTKCGMFLFQNQLIGLKQLTFNRLMTVALFSAPLSGVIIFARLFPLIRVSEYAVPVFALIVGLSALWAVGGALLADSLKAKILYLNMLFYAFVLWQMWDNGAVFFDKLIYLYPSILGIFISFLFVSVSASDESRLSQMGGFARRLWLDLALALAAVFVFLGGFAKSFDMAAVWIFPAVFLGVCAVILRGVFGGQSRADERVEALLKNVGLWYWLPYAAALGWLVGRFGVWKTETVWAAFGVFVVLMLSAPVRPFLKLAAAELLQNGDFLHRVYLLCLIMPLRLLGRVLWLAIDFVVIERSIIGSISHSTAFVVRFLQKIQNTYWVNYLIMALFGMAVILLNLGWYYHE